MEDMKKDYGLILGLLKIYEDPEPRFADFAIHCAGENGEEIVRCHEVNTMTDCYVWNQKIKVSLNPITQSKLSKLL